MKALFLFLALCLAGPRLVLAQLAPIDTTGGRYYQPVFAGVTVTSNVVYGSATTFLGATQPLLMDVYQPTGDTVKRRPLLLFAHQGGFALGSKTDAYMVNICTRMARLGYVTASIEYRLGFLPTGFPGPLTDTVGLAQAAIRGMQDMRAAVRFFRNDAATTKTYRVHSNYIVAGGSSAGGFIALEVGYLDKVSEVPPYVGIASLGGIEGTGNSLNYSSAVAAVLNLSGATENPSIIEVGNVPLCSVHGTADATVPYFQGRIGASLPPKYVYGSGRLHPRATAVGVRNTLRRFSKAGHIPFENNALYADTTFWTIRDFLRPVLRQAGTALATKAGVGQLAAIQTYPTPAQDAVQLVLPTAWAQLGEAQLVDMTGRAVRQFRPTAQQVQLPRGALRAGIYSLKFEGQAPVRIVFE
jgi:para-nitrobenzyl esterase